MRVGCGLFACGLLSLVAVPAQAHDPGLSSLTLRRVPQGLEFSVVVNHADLASRRRASSATCDASGVLTAWLDERRLPVQTLCRSHDTTHTAFDGELTVPRAGSVAIQLGLLDELPRGHRSHARLLDGSGTLEAQRLLTRGGGPLRVQVAPAPRASFFSSGIECMLMGRQQLLFLALLLLSASGMRRAVALVGSFLLAQTLALALAHFGLIWISVRWLDALIAASIVWVAAQSFVLAQRQQLATTFGFGLLHGLGFAEMLRTLHGGGSGLHLLQFNLGVEVAQLTAVVSFLPLCLWLRRSLTVVWQQVSHWRT